MASGKETPRQRMIGMMYLVLTAMLALNVSNSVLDKFVLINKSLEETIREKLSLNASTLARIDNAVSESGNRPQDRAIADKAKQVREASETTVQELEGYKKLFVERTGGLDETGKYKGLQDIDMVPALMVNEGRGDALKETLNNYATLVRNLTGDNRFHNIALDASEMEVFKDDNVQRRKNFSELHFGYNTPMVGGLASVSEMQLVVADYAGSALDNLSQQVGAGDLKIDQYEAMVKPESRVVAAGANYVAEMFIAGSFSGIEPTMTVNGRSIPVTNGKGRVEFTASADNYDENGMQEKTFNSAITVRLPNGRDTTFSNRQVYFVARPVIQIQSASVQALYLNCGNELDVQVPSLGSSYNPTFSVSGGRVYVGSKKGNITIVPRSSRVRLSVSSNGNPVGTQDFKVKRIPRPEIMVYSGSRLVDQKRGVKTPPRSLHMRAVPDESFEQFLPKDARFRVAGTEVALVRGGRAVSVQRYNDPKLNTSQLASQARAGDTYVIEVKKVLRRNFRNETEVFNNFGPRILNIRIN